MCFLTALTIYQVKEKKDDARKMQNKKKTINLELLLSDIVFARCL